MKISAGILGTAIGPREAEIDARWLMAYAAALGETAPEYLDTTRPAGIAAHPLFPVCYEWPLAVEVRVKTLAREIALRGVHVSHDLTIHRPPIAGARLLTTATITQVEPRPAGAYVVTRFETTDADGRPVSTTRYGSIHLGVQCEGAAAGELDPHPVPLPERERELDEGESAVRSLSPLGRGQGEGPPDWSARIDVPANLAHVYSECARIWNPIHTDRAVALAAGLPDIILHGTATLALAVSEVLRREVIAAAGVRRIACRFGGMVRLPSSIMLHASAHDSGDGRQVRFRALTADGSRALRDGCLVPTAHERTSR